MNNTERGVWYNKRSPASVLSTLIEGSAFPCSSTSRHSSHCPPSPPRSHPRLSTQALPSPLPLELLFKATSSLKSPRGVRHTSPPTLQPHSPRRVTLHRPLWASTVCCPDLHFGTFFGCNYMFTDLFPITANPRSNMH